MKVLCKLLLLTAACVGIYIWTQAGCQMQVQCLVGDKIITLGGGGQIIDKPTMPDIIEPERM